VSMRSTCPTGVSHALDQVAGTFARVAWSISSWRTGTISIKRAAQSALREGHYANGRPQAGVFLWCPELRRFAPEQNSNPLLPFLLPNSVALPGMDQNTVGRLNQIL
jgi:hypothetical protein